MIRKYLLSMSMAAMVILTSVSVDHAQAQATSAQSSVDQDIALLRKDIRSDKKQIIAANMQLTDAEATEVLARIRPVHSRVLQDQRCEGCGY